LSFAGDCKKYISTSSGKTFSLLAQKNDYSCGPYSLLCWLKSNDIHQYKIDKLISLTRTNRVWGSSTNNMMRGIRQLGFKVSYKNSTSVRELREALLRGDGVILDTYLPAEQVGHWALLVDIENDLVTIMDSRPDVVSEIGFRQISVRRLYTVWHDMTGGVRGAIIIKHP
jgi:hypothetical protein